MTGKARPLRGESEAEGANVRAVCWHLALAAIDGPTDELALTMAPEFRLHLDGCATDRWGYFALIEANRAAHATWPPLDVEDAFGRGHFVTARLEPRCIAHFRLVDGLIAELWMTVDWHTWRTWLMHHTMT